MPERAVLQPNGRYALFSTIVDSFTIYNATREELLAELLRDYNANAQRDAEAKLERAHKRGSDCFYDEIKTIATIHGFDEAERLKALLSEPARNARSVSPQAERWLYDCPNCNAPSVMTRPTGVCHKCANNITRGPLVSPGRVTAIKAFGRSLALLEEAYGVTLWGDTDAGLLITDKLRQLPEGYHCDAKIQPNGDLVISDWVVEPEAGEIKR